MTETLVELIVLWVLYDHAVLKHQINILGVGAYSGMPVADLKKDLRLH